MLLPPSASDTDNSWYNLVIKLQTSPARHHSLLKGPQCG